MCSLVALPLLLSGGKADCGKQSLITWRHFFDGMTVMRDTRRISIPIDELLKQLRIAHEKRPREQSGFR